MLQLHVLFFFCECFSVWLPQLWRCFSCVCFSPLVLTSVLRRKGGVHVHWLRLTGQCRDRIQRFFLCAPDVVLKTKYRMAAIDAQKMMWITNHLSESGWGLIRKQSLLIVKLQTKHVWKANLDQNNILTIQDIYICVISFLLLKDTSNHFLLYFVNKTLSLNFLLNKRQKLILSYQWAFKILLTTIRRNKSSTSFGHFKCHLLILPVTISITYTMRKLSDCFSSGLKKNFNS